MFGSLGNIFGGGIGGLFNGIQGQDSGMFGKHGDLIQTGIGLIGNWFNRRNERRKEREEQYKEFTPFTTDSDNVPEEMPIEFLISEEDNDKIVEKKKKKQFKFMRNNDLLPKKTEESVQEDTVPEVAEDISKPEETEIPKLPDHTEDEVNREQEIKEVKPPTAPKIEEEKETKEEVEAKAKKDIVEGTGYSDHLEAKIGQDNTSTDIASGSNFDKLLEVLNIIANNTGKLVELFGGNGNTTNNTVNMNVRNNTIAPPTSAKTGRNNMNDMMAIANNLMAMISK